MGIQTCSRLEAPWGTCAVRCGPEGSAVIIEERDLLGTPLPPSAPPAFSFTEDQPCLAALVFVQPAGRAGVLLHSRCGHARGVTILLSQFTEDALGYIWHQSFFF